MKKVRLFKDVTWEYFLLLSVAEIIGGFVFYSSKKGWGARVTPLS